MPFEDASFDVVIALESAFHFQDRDRFLREAFRVLYREIKTAKQAGRRVHLSIAGGRKTLSIYGMAAAQLLFDPDDSAWHLVSTPELIASQALHAGPGQAQLLSVPVLRWSQISPVLTELAMSDDPFEAVALQEQLPADRRPPVDTATALEVAAAARRVGVDHQALEHQRTVAACGGRGVEVDLFEMRPAVTTPAHTTGELAELVCSNSLRSTDPVSSAGLLKAELGRLRSFLLRVASGHTVPAGILPGQRKM